MRTVAAISTPRSVGGISVIRISGENAIEIAETIFTPVSSKIKVGEMKGYTCAYGYISNNDTRIDDGVLTVFRAPKSYTGEDVAEISCHGGIFITERILKLIISKGADAAEAGEFTKRAFLNGKMTLTQAEAVMDLISAQGKAGHSAAVALREGALYRRIRAVSSRLLKILGELAAWVDYPEDDIPAVDEDNMLIELKFTEQEIIRILSEYDNGRVIREGIDTVIAGKPNVGKSTLMNLLAGCEKSIVTDIAGTTRDIVEESVRLGDIVLKLSDTAGIRETNNAVEKIGVERANSKIETADLIIAVFDNSETLSDEDKALAEKCAGRNAVAVINKSDKPAKLDRNFIDCHFLYSVVISAGQGNGLKELQDVLEKMFIINTIYTDAGLIANERQRSCAENALSSLSKAISDLHEGVTLDAVTVLIEEAENQLLELTGERATETVVNEVFSHFCVGK